MGYDPWTAITNRYLNQEVDLLLHIFITAASESDDPQYFLDKLEVDWMAINKDPEPPEHEYIIIKTKSLNKQNINCIARKPDCDPQQPQAKGTTMKENSNTQAGTYYLAT
jgi:hypothetical protein